MSIKDCIFIAESFAHLNGREKELLPKVEAARAEHEALKKVASLAATLVWDVMEEAPNGRWQVLDDNVLAELTAALGELK